MQVTEKSGILSIDQVVIISNIAVTDNKGDCSIRDLLRFNNKNSSKYLTSSLMCYCQLNGYCEIHIILVALILHNTRVYSPLNIVTGYLFGVPRLHYLAM